MKAPFPWFGGKRRVAPAYSASKSYGSAAGGGVNDANRALERIWFSPHCLSAESQGSLFGGAA